MVAKISLYLSLWGNDLTSHLIYYPRKQFPIDITISILSFESSSIQHDVHCVNYVPLLSKIKDKAGHALGCCYLMVDKAFPLRVPGFSVRYNQDHTSYCKWGLMYCTNLEKGKKIYIQVLMVLHSQKTKDISLYRMKKESLRDDLATFSPTIERLSSQQKDKNCQIEAAQILMLERCDWRGVSDAVWLPHTHFIMNIVMH